MVKNNTTTTLKDILVCFSYPVTLFGTFACVGHGLTAAGKCIENFIEGRPIRLPVAGSQYGRYCLVVASMYAVTAVATRVVWVQEDDEIFPTEIC